MLGEKVDPYRFAAGLVSGGILDANSPEERLGPVVLVDGKRVRTEPAEALAGFTAADVYIKGANAVDGDGNAGVLMADDRGGTIGTAMGIINARGSNLIVPVGLEKLVPSVIDAARMCGQGRLSYSTGLPVGMMALVNAKVITEIEAVRILFGADGVIGSGGHGSEVRAHHVASGGVGGSEGSVTLVLEGAPGGVEEAFSYMERIKGEGAVGP